MKLWILFKPSLLATFFLTTLLQGVRGCSLVLLGEGRRQCFLLLLGRGWELWLLTRRPLTPPWLGGGGVPRYCSPCGLR